MECMICHREFKALTNTHLKRHNITPKEYETKFGVSTVPEGWSKGKSNGFYNKHHIEGLSKAKSKEYREAARDRRKDKSPKDWVVNISPEEFKKHLSVSVSRERNGMYGKTHSKEYKERLSKEFLGEGNPNWRGGIMYFPYSSEFNETLKEKIRDRENRKCFICGITENKLGRKLDVHHIDYDKENSNTSNFMAMCHNCHMQTNFNRDFWKYYLSILLNFRYGNQQPSLESNFLEGSETNSRLLSHSEESNGDTSAQYPISRIMI